MNSEKIIIPHLEKIKSFLEKIWEQYQEIKNVTKPRGEKN